MRVTWLIGIVSIAASFCAASAAPPFPDKSEQALKQIGIKCIRNDEGQIVSVELPAGSRDYHLESILEIPTIEEVSASACHASFARVKELETLPKLRAVRFEGVRQANDYVLCLKGVRNLQALSLANSDLTNHGLHDLCINHPGLLELNVSNSNVNSAGFAPLGQLRRLESLEVITQERQIGAFDTREEDRRAFGYLAELPYLKRLVVAGVPIEDGALDLMATSCRLTELRIDAHHLALNSRLSASTLIYLQNCNSSLQLGELIIPRLHAAASCRTEGEWPMSGAVVKIDNIPAAAITQIPSSQLTRVHSAHVVNVNDLNFLPLFPALTQLELDGFRLNADAFNRLRQSPKISVLRCSNGSIDLASAKFLVEIKSLLSVELSKCSIGREAREVLLDESQRGKVHVSP